MLKSPPSMAVAMEDCELGIFGSGISAYEGLCLGIPCMNLGHSEFHSLRARELAALGVGMEGGDYQEVQDGALACTMDALIKNPKRLGSMREKAMKIVDGQGAGRIVNQVKKFLDSQ